MVSDMPMNAEERACCRIMQNHCEQMGTSASHDCCQKTPPSSHDNALYRHIIHCHPTADVAIWLSASAALNPSPQIAGWVEYAGYSPPESPPAAVSVLRI
jgi:hypothetical protein